MNEKPTKYVQLDGFAESERVIFKLIFSVSQRTKSRNVAYQLADSMEHDSVDVVIRNSQSAADQITIEIVNAPLAEAGLPVLSRPLIATRVLAMLDTLISEVSQQSTESEAAEAALDVDQDIEFSISEEEASELAIVQDESLNNPANAGLEPVDSTVGSPIDSSAVNAPQEQTHHLVLVSTNHDHEERSAVVEPTATDGPHDRLTALVVDDSASVRKQLEIELDLFDVNVNYAENAQQAFELLENNHFDVAFLDVVLPDQDGFSICKSIKSNSKDTSVIMLTGKATPADKVKGSLAGCDAYLVKPVGRMTFQNTVKNYIPLQESPQAMGA